MQNRYVADIGDFVKLAILRALIPSGSTQQLGVAWWLFRNESHNADGKHRAYLNQPERWKCFDPDLFEGLAKIDREKRYDVRAIEDARLVSCANYVREFISCEDLPISSRSEARQKWLHDTAAKLHDCNIVFLDPDNGVAPAGLKITQRRAGKSVTLDDIKYLRRDGRAIILYHHQTRFKGGHAAETLHLIARLQANGIRVSGALRAKPWSPRLFFILDGSQELSLRAVEIARKWDGWITWHPAS